MGKHRKQKIDEDKLTCPNCFGTGYVEPIPPYIEEREICLTCNGTGEFDE